MQEDISFELEKLRTELRHVRGMYAIAQSEAIDASRQVSLGILFDKINLELLFSFPLWGPNFDCNDF